MSDTAELVSDDSLKCWLSRLMRGLLENLRVSTNSAVYLTKTLLKRKRKVKLAHVLDYSLSEASWRTKAGIFPRLSWLLS